MVARLTVGRDGFEAVESRMGEIAKQCDAAREAFLGMADRDAEAFEAVMVAFKLPKGSDEEKAARSAAVQGAFAAAATVPLEVARAALGVLRLAPELVLNGNPDAASDGLSGAVTLFSATVCAVANVEINAASLKDADKATELREEAAAVRGEAGDLLTSAETGFRARVGGD
jgi:formiminotetrahydrofolate cyclodeaminase